MTRPNLPPSLDDEARLIARVENLERRFKADEVLDDRAGGTFLPHLAYLKAFDDATGTGLTNNTFYTLAFDVNAPNTAGTDISIESGVPTINVDGVYGLSLWFGALSDAAADTFSFAQLSCAILRAYGSGPLLIDTHAPALDPVNNKHFAEATFTVATFLPAGTELEAQAKMSGDAGNTWSVYAGVLHVDRLV